MLLGVLLHSALSYTRLPLDFWTFKDAHGSLALDALAVTLHTFRMPVFFCLAGFFARLMLLRRGEAGFVLNRLRRVLLPLVATWLLLYLPIAAGLAYGAQSADARSLRAAFQSALQFAPQTHAGLYHLWFLYYLCLIYALLLALLRVTGDGKPASAFRAAFDALPRSSVALAAVLALPTVALLLPMQHATVDTPSQLAPVLPVLAFYVLFFGFGWQLQRQPDLLDRYAASAWTCLLLGLALRFASLAWIRHRLLPSPEPTFTDHLFAVIATAFVTWLLVLAMLGLGQRYLSRANRVWRQLADASYTVYLLHFPFTLWLPVLIAAWNLPALLKTAVVWAATTAITLLMARAANAVRATRNNSGRTSVRSAGI
ncbi:acyltransferase family protein [Hydrocarboniphaga sp.]|uniref:acyltransferase family protein n=1 Tax=Hydrocarboniphaga sp. TaxID=2033016 RepID=UPI003D137AC8